MKNKYLIGDVIKIINGAFLGKVGEITGIAKDDTIEYQIDIGVALMWKDEKDIKLLNERTVE